MDAYSRRKRFFLIILGILFFHVQIISVRGVSKQTLPIGFKNLSDTSLPKNPYVAKVCYE